MAQQIRADVQPSILGISPTIFFLILFSLIAPFTGFVSLKLVLFLLILKPFVVVTCVSVNYINGRFA